MSKDIWHTKRKKATEDKLVFAQHKSLIRDGGIDWFIWEPQEFTDAIREDVIAWCYLDDLIVCEQELIRTRKALDVAVDALKRIDWCATDYAKAQDALDEITALEQKDVK